MSLKNGHPSKTPIFIVLFETYFYMFLKKGFTKEGLGMLERKKIKKEKGY